MHTESFMPSNYQGLHLNAFKTKKKQELLFQFLDLFLCFEVGKAMSSNESAAYHIMRSLDVDYVLIIFGGVIGYSGDDINKFLWMVRIAEGEHPKDIRVSVRQTVILVTS